MFRFSKSSLKNMEGVDEKLIRVIEEALKISHIDFGIPSTGGVRTAKMQNKLYKDGLSKCDGYHFISKHQLGIAIDVFAYIDGKASYYYTDFIIIAGAVHMAARKLDVNITWGYTWKDYPHYELHKSEIEKEV